jgi:acyl CoA:acetate/3-ketoacid CoA transferase beta subunit
VKGRWRGTGRWAGGGATRAEICVAACADAWAGDGEILASPMGLVPTLGARLARLTTAPDLLLTDGEAYLLADAAASPETAAIEGWMPYGRVFDMLARGLRHVMMGASQIDAFGNQNISCIGDWARPRSQLLGVRGAPGNTVNHATSYWVREHSPRVFVPAVDMVCGVGGDRAARGPASARRFHDLRVVVSNLAVMDFAAPGGAMRLRSVHPGVTVSDVQAQTGFVLAAADHVPQTRVPDERELRLILEVLDPENRRDAEVSARG